MKLHENASRWRFVCNLDRLQLPSRTAGDAGSLHFKALFLQNRCKPADRTKANAINIQPHHSKGWIQKNDEDRGDIIRGGKGAKTKLSSNKQRV